MKINNSRTNVVIYIVEGKSEVECLRPVLSSLYDKTNPKYEVFFPPMIEEKGLNRGDITSKIGITPGNISGCIMKLYIDPFLNRFGLEASDIGEIVHIVDLDGAYIVDENIVEDKSLEKYHYTESVICANSAESVKNRNALKRANIDYLTTRNYLLHKNSGYSIPYSIYFFSSNLDHFLHGDANVAEGKDKVEKAQLFAAQYEDNPHDFIKAIKGRDGALVGKTYEESWDYIKQRNNNSLMPHTNINILLDRITDNTTS